MFQYYTSKKLLIEYQTYNFMSIFSIFTQPLSFSGLSVNAARANNESFR